MVFFTHLVWSYTYDTLWWWWRCGVYRCGASNMIHCDDVAQCTVVMWCFWLGWCGAQPKLHTRRSGLNWFTYIHIITLFIRILFLQHKLEISIFCNKIWNLKNWLHQKLITDLPLINDHPNKYIYNISPTESLSKSLIFKSNPMENYSNANIIVTLWVQVQNIARIANAVTITLYSRVTM